jgi:hypothetical protein
VHRAVQWQAVAMEAVVVIVFTLALVGIIASAVMTIAVALNRNEVG